MSTTSKKSSIDKAFTCLRKTERGKADAVFVCRLFLNQDGSWDSDASFRHWVKGLKSEGLPNGVPGAIVAAVTSRPITKQLGKLLKSVSQRVLPGHIGEQNANMISNIIENFTDKED